MDRSLKVYTSTGHLFAEFTFNYDHKNQASGKYTLYRRLYDDNEEDENKSVYPLFDMDLYLNYRKFDSIEHIKKHDIEVVQKSVGRDMTDPKGYTYVYSPDNVLLRYVAANHLGCIGMIDIRFSFINNTKEVKFMSAANPRFDFELSSNSLETNLDCIAQIPMYNKWGEPGEISTHDLTRLEAWY